MEEDDGSGSDMVGGVMGAFGSGGKIAQGLWQQWRASKIAKPVRPVALTPQGVIENKQIANQISSGSLADASNILVEQQMNQGVAGGLQAARNGARSSTDIMSVISRLNENRNNSLGNLAMQRYGQRLGGFNMLTNANNNTAGYDDRNFMYNQVEPYNIKVQNIKNLSTAGQKNVDQGTSQIREFFETMYGGGMMKGGGASKIGGGNQQPNYNQLGNDYPPYQWYNPNMNNNTMNG